MNLKNEALKMAIELMERFLEYDGISSSDYIDVMNACKAALEQPVQEPLSDDEIAEMAKEMELNEIGLLIYKGMVRAIEQAHGIGAKE